ncbi:MAG: MFS transporter, partial [Rhodospirillaceae bacterium]|nr:MFS transporter [Rhodospirillaceae bacterium]
GFAFALFYAVMAVPLGRMADTINRRSVIIVGVALWTLATAACGMARTFVQLFAARLMVGAGEATLIPAGFSMLTDLYPRGQVTRAISILTGASFVGTGIALFGGGYLIAALNDIGPVSIPLVGDLKPWQMAFVIAAAPGFVLLALMFTVREPARRESPAVPPAGKHPSLRDVYAFAQSRAGALGTIYLGCTILAAVQFGIGAWIPSLFIRTYQWTAADIGQAYGPIVLVGGFLGVVIGGWASDALMARGRADANMRVALYSALAAVPLVIAFPLVGNPYASLAILAPLCVIGSMPFGAGTAAIPLIAPNRMRAQLVAVYMLFANLIGQGCGPWLIALATDYLFGDPMLVRYSIALVGAALSVIAAATIAAGLPALRRAIAT